MPTAKCIRDTKERQLVTRSGLQGLRLRVRHLHHKQAMTAPATVRQFFGTVHHFKVDVIAGDANAAVYKYYKIQEYQDLHNSSVVVMLREMQREVNTESQFSSRLHIDYCTNNHFAQLRPASDLDCCIMAIISWRKPPGPRIIRKFWSHTRERTQSKEKEQAEDSSYSEGIEVWLRETARKGFPDPENVDNPVLAPQDYNVR